MRIPKPCLSVGLSVPQEKKSPSLLWYQSYISNWYINGKVFTSTTAWKPKKLNFFSKKFEVDVKKFCPYSEKRNHHDFVNISPLVIDAWMEMSSRVLQHGKPKFGFFFPKKFEIIFFVVFWLVLMSWNHLSFVNISPT